MADKEKQNVLGQLRTDVAAAPQSDEDEYVPDGDREAWTVVLGSSLALFASAGMINAYVCYLHHLNARQLTDSAYQGTFQDYYETTLLPSSSSSSVSLIGSLQVFFLYAFGPLTGRIFDAYGTRVRLPSFLMTQFTYSSCRCSSH